MRLFVRQIIKGGKCAVFIQKYKAKIAEKVFETIAEK